MTNFNLFYILFSVLLSSVYCLEWYDSKVLYQIYPKSFQDSDNDGIGDLKGITSRASYFKEIGVGAVWLSPIFPSPMKDNGYDISNYMDVNKMFGTLDDFKELIRVFHEQGVKVLLDLVPNHTSDKHPWFEDSVARKDGKDDYYVWRDPNGATPTGEPLPPNNWLSLFNGSAWTYSEVRKQFYLHQFGSYQPDLNFANTKVIEEMEKIMKFWLDLDVDGFRVDAVPYLVEDSNFEPETPIPDCNSGQYDCLIHDKTRDMNGTFAVLEQLGKVLNETKYKDKPRKLFLEAYADLEVTMKYYSEFATPFNFNLLQVQRDSNATDIAKLIDGWMAKVPEGKSSIWVNGNHDNSRVGTKMGEDMIDAMNMLVFFGPGNTVTYYGEEIGMVDNYLSPQEKNDSRDPERTPMQWNNEINAGFTNGTPWLPVNPNYWRLNKEQESSDKKSHLSIYKDLVKLQDKMIENTNYTIHKISSWVFGIQRVNHILLINLDDRDQPINLTQSIGDKLPSSLAVKISSINSLLKEGDSAKSDDIMMRPRSGVIFEISAGGINTASFILFIGLLIVYLSQ